MKFIQIISEMVTHPFPNSKNIIINNSDGDNINIECEYAKTPEEKITGILGMDSMCDNCGILFDTNDSTSYHMQNVPFDLDMIFCDDEGKILDIVDAKINNSNISVPNNASHNIEVNYGFCKNNNINKGDFVYMS